MYLLHCYVLTTQDCMMDEITLWLAMSTATTLVAAGIILFYIHSERRRNDGRLTDEDGRPIRLPLTVLQVRALWALGLGTITLFLIMLVFIDRGAEHYYDQNGMRVLVYLIALGGASAYGLVHLVTAVRNRGWRKDERDIAVLHWAPTVQVTGMTITLAMWAIGLTEAYWSTGYVPIAFPILIFLSTLIVGGLFQALGILIGYRRF